MLPRFQVSDSWCFEGWNWENSLKDWVQLRQVELQKTIWEEEANGEELRGLKRGSQVR